MSYHIITYREHVALHWMYSAHCSWNDLGLWVCSWNLELEVPCLFRRQMLHYTPKIFINGSSWTIVLPFLSMWSFPFFFSKFTFRQRIVRTQCGSVPVQNYIIIVISYLYFCVLGGQASFPFLGCRHYFCCCHCSYQYVTRVYYHKPEEESCR